MERLKLGRDGEREVADELDALKTVGCSVFHDLQGKDWNIDHLVIGPTGVFSIETKTRSKLVGANEKIHYDGVRLLKGKVDASEVLIQAKAQANEISELFGTYSEVRAPIQPVVLFPGWFVDARTEAQGEVWVLNPKAFSKWVQGKKRILSEQDCKTLTQVIDVHTRRVE